MSFCAAGMALCDIPTCSMTCQKSLCVAGAILLPRFQKMMKMRYMLRGRRNILETSHAILHGRGSTLDVSCCFFFANRNVRAARRGDTHHSTLYNVHSTFYTLPSTLFSYTLHFTLYTPHLIPHYPTLYTPPFTLYTSHFTLYTPHFTLHTPHPHTLCFALYTPHSTLYTLHSTLYTPHFTLHT